MSPRARKPSSPTSRLARAMRRRRSESGAAVVELAIALPVVLFIAFGVITFTQVVYTHLNLSSGVRAGARYAARSDYDPSAEVPTSARRRTAAEVRSYTAEASDPAGVKAVDCGADPHSCVDVRATEGNGGPTVELEDTIAGDTVTVTATRKVHNSLYQLAADATNAVGGILGLGGFLDPGGITVRAEAVSRIE